MSVMPADGIGAAATSCWTRNECGEFVSPCDLKFWPMGMIVNWPWKRDGSHALGHVPHASDPHPPRARAFLFPGANAVRGTQVTGTCRRDDDVPQPAPDIPLH